MAEKVELDWPVAGKLEEVFIGPARYRGAYGGRGSTKSWGFARKAIQRMVMAQLAGKSLRVLCGRELQNSLKDSVFQLIIDQIEILKQERFFVWGESFIRGIDGKSDFLFKGLRHNYREIKSTEGIDILWIEEAETTSEETFRVVLPTIRKAGSEVWLTWNPESSDAPIQRRFVDNPPPDAKIIKMNYVDNPWFSDELEQLRQEDLRRDPDVYAHVWEGECLTRTDAQVLAGKWRVDSFNMPPVEELDGGPYYGLDWGFGSDPLAGVRCWIKGKRLFIDYEVGGKGIEIKDTAAELEKLPGSRKHLMRADNARPELINHMQTVEGFRMIAADKWPGSVEDGITHLRSYDEIVIHERCVNVQREARLWSYKVDKQTGDVLPVLIDANNHWFDGVRYALAPLIRKKNFTGKPVYGGQFNQQIHVPLEELWPIKGLPIVVALAMQQTTLCAVVGQLTRRGQLRIVEEIIERETGVSQFAKTVLMPMFKGKYRGCPYTLVSFRERSTGTRQTDTESRVILDELEEAGLTIESVSSDVLSRRLEAVRWYLGQLQGGVPSISFSPSCRVLIDGFMGGYQFKRLETQGGEDIRFHHEPEKNQYALPHNALENMCMWFRDEMEDSKVEPVVGYRTYQ